MDRTRRNRTKNPRGGKHKIQDIADKLQKTPGAIVLKSHRLGLRLQTKGYINSSVALPRELPSVEETLKMLAGALKTAITPGLDRIEVQRITSHRNHR